MEERENDIADNVDKIVSFIIWVMSYENDGDAKRESSNSYTLSVAFYLGKYFIYSAQCTMCRLLNLVTQ